MTSYETVHQAALRLGVTERTIQLWAKSGQLAGARKVGRDWMIPVDVPEDEKEEAAETLEAAETVEAEESTEPESEPLPEPASRVPMPLLSTAFEPGTCMAAIEAMDDPDTRGIALAEYDYFRGQHDEALRAAAPYLGHCDRALSLSAALISCYANVAVGRFEAARQAFGMIGAARPDDDVLTRVMRLIVETLFHLPSPPNDAPVPPLSALPEGLRLFVCYAMAHRAYLDGNYERSLGLAEAALALGSRVYPIASIYLKLIATINLMNLRRVDEARRYFMSAWGQARPDGLIEGFGEHHGLLQGLVEACLRRDDPTGYERVIEITYKFSAGWRRIHNPKTSEMVADNLTTMEFTIAMLVSKGWSYQEIARHLDVSVSYIKKLIAMTYEKLGITSRRELRQYMLR